MQAGPRPPVMTGRPWRAQSEGGRSKYLPGSRWGRRGLGWTPRGLEAVVVVRLVGVVATRMTGLLGEVPRTALPGEDLEEMGERLQAAAAEAGLVTFQTSTVTCRPEEDGEAASGMQAVTDGEGHRRGDPGLEEARRTRRQGMMVAAVR